MDFRVWIWPKLKSIKRAIDALREAAIWEHDIAARNADDDRIKAEEYEEARRDITHELDFRMKPPRNQTDDSIHGNSAPVQSTRITLPKDPREIIVASLLALSIAVNVWCGWVIRDVGTAKWLHDWDLNQFQNGPYVETKIKVGELESRLRAVETSQACKR